MRSLAVVAVVVALWSCQRTPTFQNVPFVCATSGECADGFQCVMGACQSSEAGGGAAGGSTAGGSTAGGSTAGGSTAGGSTAGGSTAGGSTAGGSTAGGSTAGGAAAGGSAGGSADAGVALGGTCTTTPMCAGGLTCVDQVCCESTCTGACEVCNLAGQRGRCVNAPAGSACGLFLCDGQRSTCPTMCTTDGGCAQGASCTTSTCQRCWSAFTDSFSSGAPQWVLSGATAIGDLSLTVMSRNNGPELATARTTMTLPLAGCGVTVELTDRPDVRNNFTGRIALGPATGQAPTFKWEMDSRGLVAAWALSDGGVGAAVVAAPAATWPRWLRIEESAGQVRFRTTSTTTFTTVTTVPHSEALGALVLRVEVGYPSQPGGDRTTLAIDNVNLGP